MNPEEDERRLMELDIGCESRQCDSVDGGVGCGDEM